MNFRCGIIFSALACAAQAATIVLPRQPAKKEMASAADLAHVWLRGTGTAPVIRRETDAAEPGETGPWFFLGETNLARTLPAVPAGSDLDGCYLNTLPGDRLLLRGISPDGTALGVVWFAQRFLGVRWFWPGVLGEEVPSLEGWHLPKINRFVAPAFLSRALDGGERGVAEGEDETERRKAGKGENAGIEWGRRNGLHSRLPSGHALAYLFPPQLFDTHPEWFPFRDGQRYRPGPGGDYNWQPNLVLPEVATYAAAAAERFFDRNPEAEGFTLSENDSIHFDQSPATIQARGPLRWFRGKPDYSDVVFGFMNRAADEVAKSHPGKLLCAYAYDWCENTPTFPVRQNVVPWLTADRSQYFDEAFERADHELIERWCRSGARVIGIYEYLEGNPFLVPRQTTRLTAESIQFAYRAGVRAYASEGGPNWGRDGPKLWLAAQLLWDPHQSVEELLDEYYTRFWKEAALPMRRFDERCEQAWRTQPGPSWWLKYYSDETQARLFPKKIRDELRNLILEARAQARAPEVRKRVEVVAAAFAVTDCFVGMDEARETLANIAVARTFDQEAAMRLLAIYFQKRATIEPACARAVEMGGMYPTDLWTYLQNDPAPQVAERLLMDSGPKRMEVRSRLVQLAAGAGSPGWEAEVRAAGRSGGPVGLFDSDWGTLNPPTIWDDRTFAWRLTPWAARGVPAEGRRLQLERDLTGTATIRFEHCKLDSIDQWFVATPGAIFKATVHFRGRVSPGSEALIVLNWIDHDRQHLGKAQTERVPPGDWSEGRDLLVIGEIPPHMAFAGVGMRVSNQMGDDYAEFSQLRLRRY